MTRTGVVLVLADDGSFSDLGRTGAEIRTPPIDSLARDGPPSPSMQDRALLARL